MFVRTSQGTPPTVLLIDDDLVSREVTATVLTMLGYIVHTAEDGAAALALLSGHAGKPEPDAILPNAILPNAILMDAQMPGLSGVELIAALRARSSARIYIVSGSNPPDHVLAAADGFLLKPFGVEAVGKLLENSSTESVPSLLDANDPVINAEVLAQFRELMPEPAVRKVYEAVVVDLGRRIDALAAAMAKGDIAEVRHIGHAIKGGCGMAGATEAARLGAMLEAGDNHLDNMEALLRDLRTAARRLKTMLDAEMHA